MVTGCVSISAFASLAGVLIGITDFAVESKIFSVTAATKKYQSIVKKRRRSMI